MTTAAPPALSVILLTPDKFDRLRQIIAALQSQTIHDQIELVVVAPAPPPPLDDRAVVGFHGHQVVALDRTEFSSAEALAAGVQEARAPIVALCEDHCFPEPTWAENLLAAHRQPWAVVGPVLRNANPENLVSWADFFVGYGEWVFPSVSGSRKHLPGNNSSYKREILLAYGADLARKLEAETLLHWELRNQGYQLYLQADAVSRHINFTRLITAIRLNWWQGWSFGALRTASWPWRRRLPWVLASPLIPAVRLRRVYREVRKPGRFHGSLPGLVAVLSLILLSDGIGQMLGCAFGLGDADLRVTQFELHAEGRAYKQAL